MDRARDMNFKNSNNHQSSIQAPPHSPCAIPG